MYLVVVLNTLYSSYTLNDKNNETREDASDFSDNEETAKRGRKLGSKSRIYIYNCSFESFDEAKSKLKESLLGTSWEQRK